MTAKRGVTGRTGGAQHTSPCATEPQRICTGSCWLTSPPHTKPPAPGQGEGSEHPPPATDSLRSSTFIKSILKIGGKNKNKRKIKYQALFGSHHLSALKRSLLPWVGAPNTPGRVRASHCIRDALLQQLPLKGLPKHPTSSYYPLCSVLKWETPVHGQVLGPQAANSSVCSAPRRGEGHQAALGGDSATLAAGTRGVSPPRRLQMHQTDARLQTAGLSLEDMCPHRKSANGFLALKGEHTKCRAAAGSSHHWSISNRLIKANKQALCGYLTCSK